MNKSRSFLRLLKPGNYVDSSYFLLCPLIDKITITALYCDIIPIPYDYLDKLKTYSDTDDIYVITHIGMALKFMEENKCLDTADVNNIEIRKTIVKKITNYLDLSKSVNDQYIECVMMLYYIKAGGEVKVEYIDKIIRSQLKDGSWANGKDKDPEKGNDHSTVLALWALCAYEHDGIEKSIWIVK